MSGETSDLGELIDKWRRYPMEWPSLQAETWVWCFHCERCFRFGEAKIDDEGLLVCAYAPECDGNALDFWPWSAQDWSTEMGGQARPGHWPDEPERGTHYALYA
jgi:hypothetical protein